MTPAGGLRWAAASALEGDLDVLQPHKLEERASPTFVGAKWGVCPREGKVRHLVKRKVVALQGEERTEGAKRWERREEDVWSTVVPAVTRSNKEE